MFHTAIPMFSRVQIDSSVLADEPMGTVIGIASKHVIFMYIVQLDIAILVDGEFHTGITVPGSLLKVI